MIHCLMLINRRGLIRLVKWFDMSHIVDKDKYMREVAITVIGRSSKLCNFMEWGEYKIIYKRYASLYFITLCDKDENELTTLEVIHHFVECLDRYFGSVCELDIIFNIIQNINNFKIIIILNNLIYFNSKIKKNDSLFNVNK